VADGTAVRLVGRYDSWRIALFLVAMFIRSQCGDLRQLHNATTTHPRYPILTLSDTHKPRLNPQLIFSLVWRLPLGKV
jgi:hypothetical protein